MFDIAIMAYQNHLSARKGYGCAHRFHHGGMSCSEFALSTIRNEIEATAALRKIKKRLKECRNLTGSENKSKITATITMSKKYGFLAGGLFLVTGCGGGTEPPTSAEAINGIFVPPEPDVAANNATLAGVDSNSNGVRDDVERKIAQQFGNDPSKYQSVFNYAKTEQDLIVNGNYENYIKAVRCKNHSANESDIVTKAYLNTPERVRKYGQVLAGKSLSVTKEGC